MITTRTKLNGIKCDYVYMRLPPDKRPDFFKLSPKDTLNDNPRREPANWNRNFQEGEFVDFITPMIETLNFYHAEKVDPRIVAYSFQKLQEDHPKAELEIISMEKRGKNRQGFLLKADTAPEADHSILHAEYFDTYDRLKALPPEQLRLLLVERQKYTKRLEAWVDTAVNRPGVNIQNSNKGDTIMAEKTGDKIDTDKFIGVGFNKDGGKIEGSNFAETIYESQEQNLAQAAKDIQELLEQLDETYPSDTTAGKMKIATEVITQIDNNPTKAQRILSAIKSGGVAAVEQLLNHPASTFVIAALEDWQKSK
ncbi:MAG: hypothetical protein F6K23_33450 [Okeania sp. SIO2C9]|uniref:hypothetical protein n=1 Tax=Okeania sp. SIO2C9 TaxID=2607791 RepID=UPI0013C0276E|nr:hypothetical protein [Okeania sp. SIO2C9]NEQ77487.1 hypothetical protein [Okeania sp. SIO2C9]